MNDEMILCTACDHPAVIGWTAPICPGCIGAGIYLLICERGLQIANDNDARVMA